HKRRRAQRFRILFLQPDRTSRPFASGLRARLPAICDDDAIGKRAAKSDNQRAMKPIAVGHKKHHRDDSPRDSEHRHRCAESMIDERNKGLNYDFSRNHGYISNRSASTGGRSAARRAGYTAAATPITISVAIENAAVCHVIIIPANRAGIGARLITAESPTPHARPMKPLTRVSTKPSPKNCH